MCDLQIRKLTEHSFEIQKYGRRNASGEEETSAAIQVVDLRG